MNNKSINHKLSRAELFPQCAGKETPHANECLVSSRSHGKKLQVKSRKKRTVKSTNLQSRSGPSLCIMAFSRISAFIIHFKPYFQNIAGKQKPRSELKSKRSSQTQTRPQTLTKIHTQSKSNVWNKKRMGRGGRFR
jgi:hypothetical protein